MKKNIFVICMLHAMFVSHELWASWEIVYQNVKDTYVDNITIQEIASSALKGLSNADKNLTVGGGVNTITLYYKGRVIDTVNTPDDNANKWAEITKRFIDKSLEKSSVASQNDFMIFDMVAGEIPKALDGDSKFFENFDEANDITNKNKRTFAYRVNENVLTVKIVAFNKQTVNELKKAIAENENVDALILDLRGCAGGMSSEAIKTADLFLDSGIIASTKGRDKNKEIYYTADEEYIWKYKPVFILVDGNSASAAEILTAALKEQGIAKVIGTMTKGKGSMQKLIGLETGSVLAITNSFFMTPANNEIHKKGIKPDICTFELAENTDIKGLLQRKDGDCYKENRENTQLETKIVYYLLKKDH